MAQDSRNESLPRPSVTAEAATTPSTGYLTAEVSASAVRANLALLRSLLRPGTRVCAVVKADCYGHGLDLLHRTIAPEADVLAVATGAEALHLRSLGYDGPILMFFSPWLGSEGSADLPDLIASGVTLTAVSSAQVRAVGAVARHLGRAAEVHLKIDTGMGRSGISARSAAALVEEIRSCDTLRLTGLYTHLACADETDKASSLAQLECFHAAAEGAGGREGLLLHAANSAATIDLPQAHLDMVRPGIAVYGYPSSDQMHNTPALRPSLRLVGRLMQVKRVRAGSRCGYGLTHTFQRASRVGLVPVGYADGYPRSLSNKALMRVRNVDAPVCGRVSMDQTIIDLTDVPGAAVGDEVEIISPEAGAPHSVANLARLAGLIPYEVTCGLGNRVRRVLVP